MVLVVLGNVIISCKKVEVNKSLLSTCEARNDNCPAYDGGEEDSFGGDDDDDRCDDGDDDFENTYSPFSSTTFERAET